MLINNITNLINSFWPKKMATMQSAHKWWLCWWWWWWWWWWRWW